MKHPRLAVLLQFCALAMAAQVHAGAPANTDDANPYADAYVARMPAPARQSEPEIYVGRDTLVDYQRMLEEGYDILGYSSFEAGDVDPGRLKQQAGKLGADMALVYTNKVKGSGADGDARYAYFASYWIKLARPLLGVHVQRDGSAEDGADGLEVLAVIRDSPAALAGLQQGDVLMGLGDTRLRDPGQLAQVVQGYAGKTVEASFIRLGVRLRAPVTLAQPETMPTP